MGLPPVEIGQRTPDKAEKNPLQGRHERLDRKLKEMNCVRRPDRGPVPPDREEKTTVSDVRVLLSAVLLAMGVSAAVSAGFMRYEKNAGDNGPRIVTVRLAELAADHVLQATGSARSMDGAGGTALASPEYDAERTREWAASLEKALDTVAARHGAVLLPARAVAAGAVDVIREVKTEMELIFQVLDAAAEQEARP